jgi:glycosyltransferase involved in cell wall biosynthesis
MRIITRLNVGGPSYQAIHLTERLCGPELDCRLLVGSVGPQEKSMESLADERGVSVKRIPGLGREISLKSDGATALRIYREIRRFRPDIVHTHLAKAGAVGRVAARLARVPMVVHTYHGHVFHSYFSPRKTAVFLRIERLLARWTDRIVVLSESQEQEILGFGVGRPEQMVRIPLGLELEPFLHAGAHRGEIRRELGIRRETPLVGIVARLVPVKAHHHFLEAASHVVRSHPEAGFLIVGDGELRHRLEHQALSLGFKVVSHRPAPMPPIVRQPSCADAVHAIRNTQYAPPAVHFLGFRSDLPAIYADLDVVALSSLNEGLPVTIIEALAAARPVVATEVGAVRDLVAPGETGWLAARGDAAGLATGIVKHLEERGAAEAMGRRGRERVYPHLSIGRLESDIRELYLQLAESKLAGRAGARGEPVAGRRDRERGYLG